MFKYINLKKLTTNALMATLLVGSAIIQPTVAGNGNSSSSCKSNNGHGNNPYLEVVLNDGTKIAGQFDPSNPGASIANQVTVTNSKGKIIKYKDLTTAQITELFAKAPDIELRGRKATNGQDADCDGINDELETGANLASIDTDRDTYPDYIDTDSDGDGISDSEEGTGDSDGDGIPNYRDNTDNSKKNTKEIVDTCSTGNTVTLTGTIRDFLDTHPDFEYKIGNDRNMVTTQLGSDRKPVYGNHSSGKTVTTNGKEYFDQWYRDVDGVNTKTTYDITLTKQPNGNYRYSNTSFFPINGQLQGNQGRNRNFHFTYEIHSQFMYKGGEVLNFSGDDDVWVYINGKRVIDLGGVHAKQDASVNVDSMASTLGLEVGKVYDFDFFFAERHTTQSNFILETSIGMLCDSDKDGIADVFEGNGDTDGDGIPDYQDPDSDGDGINDLDEGTEDSDGDGTPNYLDTDSDGDGINDLDEGTEDSDGDGTPNYLDTDSDGDGIDDLDEGIEDADGDGTPNYLDTESDGDGIPDEDENIADSDGDGQPDIEEEDLPEGGTIEDVDGDGIPNYLDTDSDDDGVDDQDDQDPYIATFAD